MKLESLVADGEAGVRGEALGHGAELGRFGITGIELRRRLADHQPRCLELRRHVGKLELHRLETREMLAELPARLDMLAREIETGARAAERARADIDAAAVEPHHRNFEALAFGAKPVGDRHAAILEHHHRGRLRVPAELFLLGAETQPLGAILDHDARNAAGSWPARSYHRDIKVRAAATGDECFIAVEH